MNAEQLVEKIAEKALFYITDIADCTCEDDGTHCWYRQSDEEQAREAIAYALDTVLSPQKGAVIRTPAVDNLRNFTPKWADTPYGRIYFDGENKHE